MTTVKDLIDQLSELPQDAPILLSLDEGDNEPANSVGSASSEAALRTEVETGEAYITSAEDFGNDLPEEYQEVVVIWAE